MVFADTVKNSEVLRAIELSQFCRDLLLSVTDERAALDSQAFIIQTDEYIQWLTLGKTRRAGDVA